MNETTKDKIAWGAVFIGWLTIEIVSLVAGFVAGAVIADAQALYLMLSFGAGPLGGLLGGMIAASMSERQGARHGLIAAAVTVVLGLMLAAAQGEGLGSLVAPITLLSGAVTLGAGYLGGWIVERRSLPMEA